MGLLKQSQCPWIPSAKISSKRAARLRRYVRGENINASPTPFPPYVVDYWRKNNHHRQKKTRTVNGSPKTCNQIAKPETGAMDYTGEDDYARIEYHRRTTPHGTRQNGTIYNLAKVLHAVC
jgi:hypothetical protein